MVKTDSRGSVTIDLFLRSIEQEVEMEVRAICERMSLARGTDSSKRMKLMKPVAVSIVLARYVFQQKASINTVIAMCSCLIA